ncbi:MAG: NUMOD4 motif-containing HNH endonuclease [Microbacterium sp.]|uniref:NUMOD4 domain-containing protein n=1 Tax=Microbacterium sp. TaxID=51671 RepID=UPI0026088504|nr:NUMOD4 domain-containing protein [Microbacterium sp.]MCV0420083.1 NUMOD4 motif-containing HNH endonuclease [Microbacterium sp.]
MEPEEIWRDCKQDPGYEVSSAGRVRGKNRETTQLSRGGEEYKRNVNGQIIKPWVLKNTGYLQVMLGGRKKQSVHRMVSSAFCDGEKPGVCVNHKNGIRSDNRMENLEWVTWSENCAHAYRELGRINPCLGKTGADHPKSRAVISRDPASGVETYYASGIEAKANGFDSGSISRCCKGKSALHKGLEWRYA